MNGLPYYKAYPRDFMEGTIGMSFELKGAYRLVLDLIYMQGGRLPDDATYICGHLGCSKRAWTGYREALLKAGKLTLADGYLTNYRAVIELEKLAKLSDVQREKRLGKSKNKTLQEPQFHQPEPEPEPDKKVSATHSPARAPEPERFDEFWGVYPHGANKTGKKPARDAYRRAVARGASEQDIINGARAYHHSDRVKRGFIRNPATWLNQEGWTDEIVPQANVIPMQPKGPTHGKGTRWDLAMRLAEVADRPTDDPGYDLLPARH